MSSNGFEWKILDFFDQFKCKFLDIFNQYISEIFGMIAIVLIIMVVYWCISKENGKMIAYNSIVIMCINGILKGFINRKRPFETEGKEYLRKLNLKKDGALGSSFPSGHSMNAAGLYGSVIYFYHEKKYFLFDIFCIIVTILVGVSRIYLGVHFFTDVLFGILFSIVLLIVFSKIQLLLKNKNLFLYLVTLIIIGPFCFFGEFGRSYIKSYGLLVGFVMGTLLEEKFINFDNNVSLKNKIIRVLLGVVFVGGIYLIYSLVPTNLHNNYIFTFICHSLLAFNGFFLVPLIFNKIEK